MGNLYLDSLSPYEKIETQHYLESFPYSLYGVYEIPSIGFFYVDNLDDRIKNLVRLGLRWEEHILKLLLALIQPGSVAVDVGAHMGLHTIFMAACAEEQGVIYAFEPQKKLFRELIMNIGLNEITNIQAFRFALGNEEKMVYMNSPAPLNEGGTAIGSGGDEVLLTKLDNFCLNNVSLIKIDAEGSEDEVLDGARETILRNRPFIIIEIMGGYDDISAPREVRDKINHTKSKLVDLDYSVRKISAHDYLAFPRDL